MASISDSLVERLGAVQFGQFGPETARSACRVLLDASGVILGASGLAAEAQPFVTLAQSWGKGPCRVLGTGVSAPAPAAALANGALAHALDFEDAFDLAPVHPNASLVPALLALSQSGPAIDGRRFIAALVAGCELSCRLGLALRRPMEEGGWYPPPILAGFGATAGAAHLLGLPTKQMRDALSLALCQLTMPGEIKYSPGTVIRAVREAFPAQIAVMSALLAREGVTGFEEPFEGKAGFFALFAGGEFDPEVLVRPPNGKYWIDQLTFKLWPSCRGTHPFIAMALELREGLSRDLGQIARIEVYHDEVQTMLTQPPERKRAPAVPIDAKFSIPYCIAAALQDGRVDLDSFATSRLADPALFDLAALVEAKVQPSPDWGLGVGGAMDVILKDGTQRKCEIAVAPGGPAAPLDDAALVAKFVACSARAAVPMDRDHAERLAGAILALEDCEDVGALFA